MMQDKIQSFARAEILNGLQQLTEVHQMLFKRMYSHDDLDLPIDKVVEKIPENRLDWALSQVERTLAKIAAAPPERGEG